MHLRKEESMSEATANAALLERGYPGHVRVIGTRVRGDMHGVTVRLPDGRESYRFGPFSAVEVGAERWVAIVRYG